MALTSVNIWPVVRPFAGLSAIVARKRVRCSLQHCAHAVEGVGWGYFRAVCGELVAIHHPQIWAGQSHWLVDTTRAGLQGGGEGVGSVHGHALPVVGGVCPSRAASFSSLCWHSFRDGPIAPLVAPALMGVALLEGIASAFPEWTNYLRVVPIGLWTLGPFGGSLAV
ncbi:hypothetical protein TIFTF001_022040 [Ficus carica]|uniref:Uncharacterized protein n=1 Tax=Ficus carica TaxID=3494 RepID=A0AA88DBB0_FICCA|nr:hypothetical protein TIFTF001_022040 [Ficus carica]